ncbi:CARDB domain-containing protein [Saliphagus sp. GCM10025308]
MTQEVFVSDSSNAGGVRGTVDIQDEIREDDDEFEVTTSDFDNLDSTTGGYLVVENESHEVTFDTVGEDIVTVTGLEFSRGDVLTATLYETDTRSNELDSDTTKVIGADEPFFSVEITNTNDPVTEGDTLSLNATVENTGENTDTQDIVLGIGGETYTQAVSDVELEGGEPQTVSFEWDTQTGDAGEYTATVSSEDKSVSRPVTIEPPRFESVDAEVTRENDQNGVKQIRFDYQLTGETRVEFEILDEDGNPVGSEYESVTTSGSISVDVMDGSSSGGKREPRPVTVESKILQTSEACTYRIEEGAGDGPFSLCE